MKESARAKLISLANAARSSRLSISIKGIVASIPTGTLERIAEVIFVSPVYLMSWEDAMPENAMPIPAVRQIPLIGTIACGDSILAGAKAEGMLTMPKGIHADFARRCNGYFIINARIFGGNIVFIRQQSGIEDGQIVAVLIDNEATLKRVHAYPDYIVLSPENPQYHPLAF